MNGNASYCEACGRRLSNDMNEDGTLVEPFMCAECSDAQDEFYNHGQSA